jgi:lipopolysaccharide export system protein LptA
MECNFHALSLLSMLPAAESLRRSCLMPVLAVALAAQAWPVHAERSDSQQALTFDAGRMVLDGKRKVRTLSGGVEITRGTLVLKAGQVELKETAQGQFATATGADGQPATFRQKRDGLDEFVEGQARRIEYDTATETVRFLDQAQVRVLRGGVPADQVTGQTIVYHHARDVFEVQGGTAATPGGTGGRVKGVVTPRKTGTTPPADGGSPETPR